MISFHLLAVPAEAITQYLASHSEYCAYDEDTDTSIYPDELFDIEQLCDSSTDHTSFEHNAELDAKILTKMGFGDLFEDGILDEDDEIIGYKFVQLGRMMEMIKKGMDANEALEKASGQYGRVDDAAKLIDPREE